MVLSVKQINELTEDIVSFDMRPEDTEVYMKYIAPLPEGSVVLDIGTGQAKNVIRMSHCNPKVEIWTWDWGRGGESIPHTYFKMIIDRLRDRGAHNVYFTISNSDTAWQTWDRPVDIINLDAAHDYDTTVKDLNRWVPFLKNGGYLFVHDYEYRGQIEFKFEGMRKAVKEYCTPDKFEFLEYHGGTQVIKKL